MPLNTICKTIHQFNKETVSDEQMLKLQAIADDYSKVKNYVYMRFGGINSLKKIYPGYTVQNEMAQSGLREQLEMPSVYFYLAIFEALGDIKNQWTAVKKRVLEDVKNNKNLTSEEMHYLRYVLKINNILAAILNYKQVELINEFQDTYQLLSDNVEVKKLDNYLRRRIRKHLCKLHTDKADGFSIAERAYRYADHGIYISIKEKRKRIFILLADSGKYTRQLYIKLDRVNNGVEILVPVNERIYIHDDYINDIGLSMGLFTMFTTDEGHKYGDKLGEYVIEGAEWIKNQNICYRQNKADNPGRKKYLRQKQKKDARLKTYINTEINRFIYEEKPKVVYLPKFPATSKAGKNKTYNRNISFWQKGYIKRRLTQKCKKNSIKIVEVFGKDISNECSKCGAIGKKENGFFICNKCGNKIEEKINAAQNAKKRGASVLQKE